MVRINIFNLTKLMIVEGRVFAFSFRFSLKSGVKPICFSKGGGCYARVFILYKYIYNLMNDVECRLNYNYFKINHIF